MKVKEQNVCIYCGKPLSKWENIRNYCWSCRELTSETVDEEDHGLEEQLSGIEKVNSTDEILLLLD